MSDGLLPRILLVDDDDGIRRAFARGLRCDFDVVDVDDGDAAIQALEAAAVFDVIVTDLEMARVSGDALVAWLVANRPAMAARVVVMSGGAKDASRAAWLTSLDPARVVHKPCSLLELVGAIRRVR